MNYFDNSGPNSEQSGESDSEHSMEDKTFVIRAKSKHFNKKKHLVRYLNRNIKKIDGFDRIVCCGNSYDLTSCEYIAELIGLWAANDLHYADFSDMFT